MVLCFVSYRIRMHANNKYPINATKSEENLNHKRNRTFSNVFKLFVFSADKIKFEKIKITMIGIYLSVVSITHCSRRIMNEPIESNLIYNGNWIVICLLLLLLSPWCFIIPLLIDVKLMLMHFSFSKSYIVYSVEICFCPNFPVFVL